MPSSAATFAVHGTVVDAIEARFANEPFDPHFHESYSIGLIIQGVNTFSLCGRRVDAEAGSICLTGPGDVHDGGLAGSPWAYVNAFPSIDLMASLALEADCCRSPPAFQQGMVADPHCAAKLRRLFALVFRRSEAGDTMEVEEAAIDAFSTLILHHASDVRPDRQTGAESQIARKALEVLNDDWRSNVSLDHLAIITAASRFRVIRAVAAATGLTPHAYLIQRRVQHAIVQIRAGARIADTAFACGFADQAHLTRAMKRRWGVTPGVIRQLR